MQSMGAIEILESTKKHFPRKLEKEFGNVLQFEDLLDNNKLFVLPKNVSKAQLAREMVKLPQQIDNRNTPSKIKETQQSGLYIHDVVLSNNTEMSWPPEASKLCESAINLPAELDAFLYTLLTGNTEIPAEYPHRVRRLVTLLGRTGGRQKPPKQYCYHMRSIL